MSSMNQIPLDCRQTFSRYINLLGWIGFNIFDESPGGVMRDHIKLFICNALFLPVMCIQFTLLFKINSENFLEGSRCVPISIVFAMDFIKMITAVTKRSQMRETFIEIGNLWPKQSQNKDEKAVVLNDVLRRMRFFLNAYFIYSLTTLTLFELAPLLASIYNMYIGVNEYIFPFQLSDSWQFDTKLKFILTYLWEVVATTPVQLCLYLPMDTLLMILTVYLSLLFRLLQIDLQNAIQTHDDDHTNIQRYISDDDSYQRIKQICVKHQKLLRLADNVSDIFSTIIFTHIICASIVICFYGFRTVVYGGVAETIANLMTVFSSVITTFLLCLAGQLLSDASYNISEAAYSSHWYQSDIKVRKVIHLIMIRAQRPSNLSALGFSDLTFRAFSKIMSSSWTYFTLLVQLYTES